MSLSELRVFGRSGTPISPLTLGTMNFGEGPGGASDSAAQAAPPPARTKAFASSSPPWTPGITAVDTADVYSQGESEQVVGRALRGRRDDVFLATKFHGQMSPNPAHSGNSRRWIMQAVEGSLRRLQTDRIDLYQAHRPDYNTDVLETITALNDLIRQGKILYYGTSVFTPAQLVEAQWLATTNHLIPPVANQVPYSMLVRGNERDVLPIAQQYGLGVLAYGPLAGGWLSGEFVLDAGKPPNPRAFTAGPLRHLRALQRTEAPGRGFAGPAGGQAGDLPGGAFRRLRTEPPGREQRDHRPPHRSPPPGLPQGGGHPAERTGAGCDR